MQAQYILYPISLKLQFFFNLNLSMIILRYIIGMTLRKSILFREKLFVYILLYFGQQQKLKIVCTFICNVNDKCLLAEWPFKLFNLSFLFWLKYLEMLFLITFQYSIDFYKIQFYIFFTSILQYSMSIGLEVYMILFISVFCITL